MRHALWQPALLQQIDQHRRIPGPFLHKLNLGPGRFGPVPDIPLYGRKVYFKFDNEFWNDELHNYRFFIDDRCYTEERWE